VPPILRLQPAAVRAVGLVVLLAAAGCTSPQERPPAPTPPPDVVALMDGGEAVPLDSGPPRLLPYLEQFPLGNRGRRKDLLASDDARSMHLVQLALPLPEHTHPERTEIAYVLRGRGLVRIDGRGYPAAPGAAFRIEPGTPHSVVPDEGETLIAIVYYDPPLLEGDDSVPTR
jgi:mannose-6-phosphate isomerase-like protein (cupin superfamily)